jgi:hypothetical protein
MRRRPKGVSPRSSGGGTASFKVKSGSVLTIVIALIAIGLPALVGISTTDNTPLFHPDLSTARLDAVDTEWRRFVAMAVAERAAAPPQVKNLSPKCSILGKLL